MLRTERSAYRFKLVPQTQSKSGRPTAYSGHPLYRYAIYIMSVYEVLFILQEYICIYIYIYIYIRSRFLFEALARALLR